MSACLLFAAPITTLAAPEPTAGAFSVPFASAGTLAIRPPDRWKHTVVQRTTSDPATAMATVTVTAPDNFSVTLMITLIEFPKPLDPKQRVALAERKVSESMAGLAASQSVEKKVTLRPLTSKLGAGSYAVITDASLVGISPIPEGKFLNVSHGVVLADKLLVEFTVLSNNTDSQQYRQALQIITDGLSVP